MYPGASSPWIHFDIVTIQKLIYAACGGEGEGETGAPSHCPPDSVPQTPAGDFAPGTPFKFTLLGAPQIPAGGLCPPVTCPPDRFPLLNSYKDF